MSDTTLQPFYTALMQFLALSKQQLFRIAAGLGLTSTQAFLLMLSGDDGEHTMHYFGQILGCDASNITGIVDGLERKNLLQRAEHATDRRIKIIRLLPEGARIREAILKQLSDSNQSYILSHLSKAELTQFTALIQKITAGCTYVPGAGAAGKK